ncbi:aldo/keto reductase [Nonomuraea monospora]|uniref:Aldo/keto reductase n=1 Tax=Nonomuraea monospora TaxID=568818 RepID=A0ABN3CI18_9ACTN
MTVEPVLGTMTFGDTVNADTAGRMLDLALDAGVTGVDTANGYAAGASEEILGTLLRGRRSRVKLATKAGIPHPDAAGHAPLSPTGLRLSLEGSLRRLGTDHVDLFYLHQPDRATPLGSTLATVADLMAEGKIGSLGVSNYAAWQIALLNPRPVVAQQLYNLLARRVEDEYAEFAVTSGLRTMVYNPLGGGLLTGRHRFDQAPGAGRFGDSRLAAMYRQRYWDAELFKAVEALGAIALEAGVPPAELSLRWLLGKPMVNAVLLGASDPGHLRANLSALAAGPLPADVSAACDAVGDALRGPMPAYSR